MTFLYKKSRIFFAVAWIIIYVFSFSLADTLSLNLGREKSLTAAAGIILSAIAFLWIKKEKLLKEYGLCKMQVGSKRMLYYLPLIFMLTVNIIFGIKAPVSLSYTAFYVISMLSVGFLEEIIFRGFLFKAIRTESEKVAIIVSSVTFGMGHIINLLNGNSESLLSSVLQVFYAIAAGFLFTFIFIKTGSLVPQIIFHGLFNSLSVFTPEFTPSQQIISSAILLIIPAFYSAYIIKRIPSQQ